MASRPAKAPTTESAIISSASRVVASRANRVSRRRARSASQMVLSCVGPVIPGTTDQRASAASVSQPSRATSSGVIRSWPHQTHLAASDVPELRHFIEFGSAKHRANAGHFTATHRAQLPNAERPTAQSYAVLREERGPTVLCTNRHRGESQHGGARSEGYRCGGSLNDVGSVSAHQDGKRGVTWNASERSVNSGPSHRGQRLRGRCESRTDQ